jgi:MFS family permease
MKTFWINKFRHSPQIGYCLGGKEVIAERLFFLQINYVFLQGYLLITCSGIFLGILIYNADLRYAQEWVHTASIGAILSVFCCWFIGAIFGGLCSGWLIDRTGRKLILVRWLK